MRLTLKQVVVGSVLGATVAVLMASPATAGVSTNLLANPGAESGDTSSWTSINTGWSTSAGTPITGAQSFVPTTPADSILLGQRVDLSAYATDIVAGTATVQFGGSGSTGDAALVDGMLCKISISLGFRNAANDPTASQVDFDFVGPGVHSGQSSAAVPVGTDHVELWITGRNYNDGQTMESCVLKADDLFLTITGPSVSASAGLPPTGLSSLDRRIALVAAMLIVAGGVSVGAGRRGRRLRLG